MNLVLRSENWAENARFVIFVFFLACCFVMGGASRLDVFSLILLQPLSVVCAAAIMLIPGPIRFEIIKMPMLVLLALATIMALQLVPLPPAIWTSLPGHDIVLRSAAMAGIEQPWRPISLTPDLTLASLSGLVVPAVALIGFASLSVDRTYWILPVLLIGIALSALLGLAQIAGGPRSSFYLYAVTNNDSPVGFFSNRNHQALLIAIAWPFLALWAGLAHRGQSLLVRRVTAGAAALFLVLLMVVTGSRAGLFLAVVGIAFAWLEWRRQASLGKGPVRPWIPLVAFVVLAALVVVVSMGFSRDAAIERAFGTILSNEGRWNYLPVLVRMTQDFLPFGSGFGSFDPVFRVYEPADLLQPTYLNHAHNDLLELAITGGVPALVILLVFAVWAGKEGIAAFRSRGGARASGFGRLGLVIVICVGLSSLVDYPLRTPLIATIFAIACGWLGAQRLEGLRTEPRP